MRLMRIGNRGAESPAVLTDDGHLLDVSGRFRDFDETFFASNGLESLREFVGAKRQSLPEVDPSDVRVGACIGRPHQVLCLGLNYGEHASEVGEEFPSEPVIFNKAPHTVVGPFDEVWLPPGQVEVDWEVELAVVIGRECRYLSSRDQALDHVAGYCISNDVSERVAQLRRGGQWVKGKSFDTFNPCGPWLVTADEVDPSLLDLRLYLNGELMQEGNTKQMIMDVAQAVWYLSQFMTLLPGDLINTGTPPGVGMAQEPPRFLEPGDVMELEISGLGRQRQRCVPLPAVVAGN